MMRRRGSHPLLAWPALALSLASAGCTGSGMWSTANDWSAYRATRVEPTFELRLGAAQRYLADRPSGAFRYEVRAWFERAEDVFYATKKDSRAGLHAYLDALPTGPHKEEAEIRLKDLEGQQTELQRTAADVEARLTGPGATARAAVRTELGDWLSRWLDPRAFHTPLAAASADLVIAFGLSLPNPRCEVFDPPQNGAARRCVKLVELPYVVEGARGPEAREATLEVTVLEDGFGGPLEVTLGGPDLFLRLEETYRIKPIAPDDAPQRLAAAARAATLVKRAFGRSVSAAASCERPVQAPAVLRLACEGLQVEVFPTANPGEDDLISIVPIGAVAP